MVRILVAAAVAVACLGDAQAQSWPARPINMVVPYAAGGPVDTIGRIMGARLSELLGQQVIIENIGGAGGMTGAARVAKAAPDGYTLLMSGSAVLAINQTLYKKPLYNAGDRFRARRDVLGFGTGPDRAAELSGQYVSRVRRLRQAELRQDAIWLRRCRLRRPCLFRAP